MKYTSSFSFRFTGFVLSFLIFIGALFSFTPNSHAKADNGFSRPYGLIVHNKNQNRVVPRIKALEVLLKYFSEVKSKKKIEVGFKDVKSSSRVFGYVEKGCKLKLFNCEANRFYPYRSISQKDFLNWFFKLKYAKEPKILKKQYSKIRTDHVRVWLEARRLNLLTGNQITYNTLQNLLYRNEVVEANLGQPYSPGLAVDVNEITMENYHNLKEIDFIQGKLKQTISDIQEKKKLTKKEKMYLRKVKENFNAFQELKNMLSVRPYLLQKRLDLDPEISQAVRRYGLQEVLYSHSYDYSKNAAYRKYNLVTGVKKMHGKLCKPGDIIDYWKIISDRNLWDFRYGWVIANGTEEWLFGGGICGSSSLVFLPSWKSGLEILERRNHSKYFTYLYPMKDIGLDATVFRPRPNLKMRNNMDDPIIFNVTDDKEKQIVTIEIIGNLSYKSIRIEGPIFLKRNHVKWIRHFEDFNGNVTSETLESRYGGIY